MIPTTPSKLQRAYNLCKKLVLLVLPFVNTVRVASLLKKEAADILGDPKYVSDPYLHGYLAALEDVAELLHVEL